MKKMHFIAVFVVFIDLAAVVDVNSAPGDVDKLSVASAVWWSEKPRRCNTGTANHDWDPTIFEPSSASQKRPKCCPKCQIPGVIGWIQECCLQTAGRANRNINRDTVIT